LSAELADCERGATIWSDRFGGEAADLFELQDELSARVVATIAPQVQESELRRVLRKRPESLDAYECVLRGLDLLNRFDDDDKFMQALPMFQRAMTLDPTYAPASALAATWARAAEPEAWRDARGRARERHQGAQRHGRSWPPGAPAPGRLLVCGVALQLSAWRRPAPRSPSAPSPRSSIVSPKTLEPCSG